jgi:nitrate reductase NapE component
MTTILILTAIIVFIEIILRLKKLISSLFVETVTKSDYISKKYHKYLQRVDNWNKPIFKYIPIGLRVFNNDNPIPEVVINNSLGFRSPDFDEVYDDEKSVIKLYVLLASCLLIIFSVSIIFFNTFYIAYLFLFFVLYKILIIGIYYSQYQSSYRNRLYSQAFIVE